MRPGPWPLGARPACAPLSSEMARLWAKKGSLLVLPFEALPSGPGRMAFEKALSLLVKIEK